MTPENQSDGVFDNFFQLRLVSYRKPQHEGPTCEPLDCTTACQLAILEFDDQGLGFTRFRMDDLQDALNRLADSNPIIVVFVHGWKHNASPADGNLELFAELLRQTAEAERMRGSNRPMLGIFVAWRGLSRDGNWFWTQSSFWDRRQAAQRVAHGSLREVLGRLKAFRNGPAGAGGPPRATLVIVGHSFGGLIVYVAIAQSLIQAAATQKRLVPSFGDLVVLVNPAFSAISYMPILEIVRYGRFDPDQLPVCVSVTAENDWATGCGYTFGSLPTLLTEAWRTGEEKQALIHTMGHLSWMRTHAISATPAAPEMGPTGRDEAVSRATRASQVMRSLSSPTVTAQSFGAVTVRRLPNLSPSPFWVASATKDVIDGHNGIAKPAFLGFLRALVAAHLAQGSGPLGQPGNQQSEGR